MSRFRRQVRNLVARVDRLARKTYDSIARIASGLDAMLSNFKKRNAMIYELRVYHCMPGRLPALLKRFETITINLWKKHGIRQAGFWTVVVGESNLDLYYLLEWESLGDRDKKWQSFQDDPEWIAKRAETERDGPIVRSITNTILQPTSFSSVK